jgi:hypothetical protein
MESHDITISFFEDAIPDSIESEMEQLYQNPYSTLAHHRAYGDLAPDISTYVARKSGMAVAVLLLRRDRDRVQVLNEQIRLAPEELNRFVRYIFASFAGVNVILFHAVDTQVQRMPFPCQHFSCTEDIVLELPPTVQDYRARLGKATRSYISRYLNKLRRDFPTLRHEVYRKGDIGEHRLRQIIDMNRARMAGKNRESYIDEDEARRIVELAARFGLVSVLTIDGRVCAGAINYRIGDNYFLKVIAHDSAYDDYRIGTLCCYLSICECIERGGKEYHFLWGRYEYKYRLLGVQRDLDHVTVYRSRTQVMLNGRMALRNTVDRYLWRARSSMMDRMRQSGRLPTALRFAAQTWRSLKSALLRNGAATLSRRGVGNSG